MKKRNLQNFKSVKVMLGGKEIVSQPFTYSETKDDSPVINEIIQIKNKKHLIQILKNIGIELIFNQNLEKPCGYTCSNNTFTFKDQELKKIIETISFDEWSNNY